MAASEDPIPARAAREATDWLILLQDAPEDRELLRRFRDWLRRSPVNASAWEQTRRTVAAIDGGAPALAALWQPALTRLRSGARQAEAGRSSARPAGRLGRRQALGLAALGGLAAAACLSAVLYAPRLAIELQADQATGTAETKALRLADGSRVTLAPESALRIAYGGSDRRVELLRGTAFFEVAPDPERPFRVASEAVEVTVLGTGFEVRQDRDGTAVAVAHGSVRLDDAEVSPPLAETLRAGETARVLPGGGIERGRLPAGQVAAWRRYRLIAQDQPLGELVDRLRPYFPGAIIVTGGGLAGRPVTGVYDLADPRAALRGIARAQNAVVRELTPWILVVSAS
ncbi:FecR family protein [Tistlia consotensis]|uniref:FecR family protein n=1 Tax=Tistlia consotensis USBA 355 TaxID=560819 RepID=A0A1Y6CGI9_9PROT|nr:FecR domain-containing protein [Tistlia consotensis]SMF64118.1 FecR family protein [Tistlia consotensis USBA 355]SNR97908.1 FecR family protein [Tistlia consotensis]